MSEFFDRVKGLSRERLALVASELQQRLEQADAARHEGIAIIGMAGRYPGAGGGLDEFWELLLSGRSAIAEASSRHDAIGLSPLGGHTSHAGAFLDDYDGFDADFFTISAREAENMDPQQRLLLEVAWSAFEDAGRIPSRGSGVPVGVFVGICTSDYAQILLNAGGDCGGYFARGTAHSLAAGRLSYALGLQGPCIAVDTACSSSLVATHLACRSLRNRECDLAVVGGVNLVLSPLVTDDLAKAGLLSSTGSCRPFDARADGYVRGEGCGAVVLKRLSDAVRDGDRILAIVRGSAVNHDGGGAGLIAPSGAAQRAAIEAALADARVNPADIDYVETSSVGTLLGDPIELESLGQTVAAGRADRPLVVGTLKPNIGHLEGAAGIAALTKAALTLQRGVIAPYAGFDQPSPHIPWRGLGVTIPRTPRTWPADRSRLAGVSAFSFSGANVHLVLEQAPERRIERSMRGPWVLPLSARSDDALRALATSVGERLRDAAPDEVGDAAFTAAVGRRVHTRRAAVVAATGAAAADALDELVDLLPPAPSQDAPRIAFLFPSEGLDIADATRLFQDRPVFREALERCAAAWTRQHVTVTAEELLADESHLPCAVTVFCHQYALAAMWRAWGAEPSYVLGDGVGELAAAAVAGVLDVDNALALANWREPQLAMSGHAGSGMPGLAAEPGPAAPHLRFGRERCHVVSGVTGAVAGRGELNDPEYWTRQRSGSPGYRRGVTALRAAGADVALVIGRQIPADAELPLLPIAIAHESVDVGVARALAALFTSGTNIDWVAVHEGTPLRRVAMPTYPFQHRRYWPTPMRPAPGPGLLPSPVEPAVTPAPPLPPDSAPVAPHPDASGRVDALVATLTAEIAQTLGCEPAALQRDASLLEHGLDSLRALQLADRLTSLVGVAVPLTRLAHVRSIRELATLLAEETPLQPATGWRPLTPEPAARFEPFPLTDVQQAYWLGRLGAFSLGGVATHFYVEYDVSALDLDRLERALRLLVARHDMLRAVVLPTGRQRVLASVPDYRIERHDLSLLPAGEAEAAALALRGRLSHEVRDVSQWPLFGVVASRRPDGSTRLHVSIDLLIADAWSIQRLAAELAQLYADPDLALPACELTFRDCVLAAEAAEQTEPYRRSADYWRARLDTLPPPPDLPLARHPAEIQIPRFVRRTLRLERARWERLQHHAMRHGVSRSTAVLTAFAHVLRYWARQPRFTLNLTFFNRPPIHSQVGNVIGDFTSLVLLDTDLTEPGTFRDRAHVLQRQLWEDLDHRHFSGVRVLRDLAARGGRGAEAMMPVVFTSGIGFAGSQSAAAAGIADGRLTYSVSQTPQVWLDHQVFEVDGELVLIWDAVEDLFPAGLLDDMFGAYQQLLDELTADTADWAERVAPLLPPAQAERRRRVNDTATPLEAVLLHELFHRQVLERPQAVAVIDATETLDYRTVAVRATALAARLRQAGVRSGDLVAVVMDKGWEQVVATLGILESGAAYVPIDPAVPAERLSHLVASTSARVAVTQRGLREAVPWPRELTLIIDDLAPESDGWEPLPRPASASPSDVAYVIYTSGSTGMPKGVVIDHRGAVNTISDINRRFAVDAGDRVLALSSLTFDLSVWDIFGMLAAGGAIVFPDRQSRRDPEHWRALLHRHQVTVWNTVPTLMRLLVESAEARHEPLPAALRLVMMSGDWIPVDLPDRIRSRTPHGNGLRVVSLGGATEASIWSVLYPIGAIDPAWTSVPYGYPMANQALHVLDEEFAPRPDWTPGDLYIEGVGLAREYWRDPERTGAAFLSHPRTGKRLYRTGDLARYLPDGSLEFLGRQDAQVKINGYRVELGEIESRLQEHPDVRSVVCLAQGARDQQRRLVACVVPREGRVVDPSGLRDFLAERLPDYLVPGACVAVDELPLGATGKIDRAAALRLVEAMQARGAGPRAQNEAAAPADALTQRLIALVADELHVDSIDAETNLLGIGASSLDMLRLVDNVESALGFRPRVEDFFHRPTIDGLVDLHRRWLAGEPVGQDGDAESAAGPADTLEQRASFKRAEAALRRFPADRPAVALAGGEVSALERGAYASRRTHREFDEMPIPFAAFARTLACLRRVDHGEGPRRLYASANGLYAVQTYVYVKPGRIEGVSGGTYYFAPETGALVQLSAGIIPNELHVPYNQRVAASSAFAVFLIAAMDAIEPLYGELSPHLVRVEAGLMTQLLDLTGPGQGVGFCQIGTLAFDSVRELFDLQAHHLLIHTLLGGRLAGWTPMETDTAEREIGTI